MNKIEIRDVSPRDGLQDLPATVSTEHKHELVRRLWGAGVRAIEVTSFVSPKRVPQLSDAAELCALVAKHAPDGVVLSAFVPNARGAERALAAGIDELSTTVPITDGMSRANFGMDSAQMFNAVAALTDFGSDADLSVTISVAFGCPYDGVVTASQVRGMVERLAEAGYSTILLGDTIGVADPRSVEAVFEELVPAFEDVKFGAHFHDARGAGVANVIAAVEAGATLVDAALGGLGGCPFAPGAAGNVATEDVCWALGAMGFEVDPEPAKLATVAGWMREELGVDLASRMPLAARFEWEPYAA